LQRQMRWYILQPSSFKGLHYSCLYPACKVIQCNTTVSCGVYSVAVSRGQRPPKCVCPEQTRCSAESPDHKYPSLQAPYVFLLR